MSKKTFKEFAEACWDSHKQDGFKMKGGKQVPNCVPKNEEQDIPKGHHRMPDGSIMKNSDHSKKKDEENIEEVSAAMRALRRRNAKSAYAAKTIAKYGQARQMGIPADKVNQRLNTPTRTK